MRRTHKALALPILALGLPLAVLSGCGDTEKDTGPEVVPEASAPFVAPSEVPAAVVPPADNPLGSFDRLAVQADGQISSAVYAKAAQQLFEMMDVEHDGNLSAEELAAGARLLVQIDGMTPDALLKIADNDKDGKINLSEWMAYHNGRFTRFDSNGDGMISRAEWDAAIKPAS
ncbi:EF-hand domain-containing protein [Novosphingobium sp. B1]|uniref:EF-hand domain-containing protein n=1 Tax=Novosphingobium sp. B1 TaxID=1938756 RepID=UPI0009D7EB51|nr:EF-hand domain-containing protein [Novosphingobium sp. B1]SMC80464.1 EF hand [Novosphingobium sp. B1]